MALKAFKDLHLSDTVMGTDALASDLRVNSTYNVKTDVVLQRLQTALSDNTGLTSSVMFKYRPLNASSQTTYSKLTTVLTQISADIAAAAKSGGGGGGSSSEISIALGINSSTTGDHDIAIGYSALSAACYSIAIGSSASVNGEKSIAIGAGAYVGGNLCSIAIGDNVYACGLRSIAIGSGVHSDGDYEMRFGNDYFQFILDGCNRTIGFMNEQCTVKIPFSSLHDLLVKNGGTT